GRGPAPTGVVRPRRACPPQRNRPAGAVPPRRAGTAPRGATPPRVRWRGSAATPPRLAGRQRRARGGGSWLLPAEVGNGLAGAVCSRVGRVYQPAPTAIPRRAG